MGNPLKRNSFLVFGCLTLGVLSGFGALIYRMRTRERISGLESLEDPDVVRAFVQVSTTFPWKLLRWYLSRRILSLQNVGQAVDLGCGPGFLILAMARRSRKLRLIGIDCSEEILMQAKKNANVRNLEDRISFKVANSEQLPFNDHSLDLVVSTLSLHHWENPVAVMNEISRVLKPGGCYLIFDLRRDMPAPIYVFLWMVTHFVVPVPLRRANEPMSSRNAAFTPREAANLVQNSHLDGHVILDSPAWFMIQGKMAFAKS